METELEEIDKERKKGNYQLNNGRMHETCGLPVFKTKRCLRASFGVKRLAVEHHFDTFYT